MERVFWGGVAAGAVLVMAVGPYLLGRGIGAAFARRNTSTARVDAILLRTRSALVGLLCVGGFVTALPAAFLLVRVWQSVPTPVLVGQIAVVTALVTAVADRALQRGLEPLLAARRAGEPTVPQGVRRRERVLPLVVPLWVGVVAAVTLFGYAPLLPWFVLGVIAMLPVYQWPVFPLNAPGSPIYSALARDPTDAEQRRIEACYEQFDRTPPRIRVRPGSGVLGSVVVTGSGVMRTLTVESPFLDRVDDDTLAAVLATADEQGRRRFRRLLFSLQIPLTFTLVYSLIEFVRLDGLSLVWLGAFFAATLGLVAVSVLVRPRVFAADAFAASHLGDRAVVDALDRVGDDVTMFGAWRDAVPGVAPLAARFRPEPPIGVRIDRLDAEPTADTGPDDEATRHRPGPRPDADRPADARGPAGAGGRTGQGHASPTAPVSGSAGSRQPQQPTDRPRQPTGRDVARDRAGAGGPGPRATDQHGRGDHPGNHGSGRPDTRWKRGILASTLVLLLALPVVLVGSEPDAIVQSSVSAPPVLQGIAALAVVFAWLALPIAMYKDSAETRPLTGWPTYRKSYLLGSLLLPYNLLVVALYLWKRPSPSTRDRPDRGPPADRRTDGGRARERGPQAGGDDDHGRNRERRQ